MWVEGEVWAWLNVSKAFGMSLAFVCSSVCLRTECSCGEAILQ